MASSSSYGPHLSSLQPPAERRAAIEALCFTWPFKARYTKQRPLAIRGTRRQRRGGGGGRQKNTRTSFRPRRTLSLRRARHHHTTSRHSIGRVVEARTCPPSGVPRPRRGVTYALHSMSSSRFGSWTTASVSLTTRRRRPVLAACLFDDEPRGDAPHRAANVPGS